MKNLYVMTANIKGPASMFQESLKTGVVSFESEISLRSGAGRQLVSKSCSAPNQFPNRRPCTTFNEKKALANTP